MASTESRLMTFAEFEQLPEPRDGCRYELRHGQLAKLAPPQSERLPVQNALREALDRAGGGAGRAYTDVGFRARPEHEFRTADVVYASKERWDHYRAERYFQGAPELVVEVSSAASKLEEILDKKTLCLENGAREFWVLDLENQRVEVFAPDGQSATWKPGQQIPLMFGGTLAVSEIFG